MMYFVVVLVQAIIFGFATKRVIEDKGYDDDWFWWGFFFGLIALVVALAKPQKIDYFSYSGQPYQPTYTSYQNAYGSNVSNAANKVHNEQLLTNGGWKCSCGRVLASYVSSCSCGKSKSDVKNAELKRKLDEEARLAELKKQEETQAQATGMCESSKVSAIKEYKELMDAGIISQEEFEAKKKQLLGL